MNEEKTPPVRNGKVRRILALIIGLITGFFAFCAETGAMNTPRSHGWALFYTVATILMLIVVLQKGQPIVHVGVNVDEIKKKFKK